MKEFAIFTDGDVDLPAGFAEEISLLPQYYYFEEDTVYGDEKTLTREEFFERLKHRRAYTSGVNPALVSQRFEETLQAGKDILCITVSSGLSGSHNTICMTAASLKERYPAASIEVIDSLRASLGSGFLCVDAIESRRQGKTLAETADEIRRRVGRVEIYFIVDDFKYLVQGGRVSPAVGKIGDFLDIKVILTMKDGRIEPYKKCRGLNIALQNIKRIAQSRPAARLGAIYVGNAALFEKCKALVGNDSETALNLIVSSHVGPNATGVAIEWAGE